MRPPSPCPALRTAFLLLVTALLCGCALTPPKPPQCDGPWVPINTAVPPEVPR